MHTCCIPSATVSRAQTAERVSYCALAPQGKSHAAEDLASTKNRILSRLSAADMALLTPDLEPVELPLRHVLEVPNEPITHSYFIENGLASTVAGNRHKRIEVGLIGCDGMTGLPIVLGNDRSPNETFMQVAGDGRRIAVDKLRAAISQSRSLELALLDFTHSFINQTSSTALSNGTGHPGGAVSEMASHG